MNQQTMYFMVTMINIGTYHGTICYNNDGRCLIKYFEFDIYLRS